MGKESEYTFAKLSGGENYKEWAREMIFALKDSGLWEYVDGTIIRPVSLAAIEKGATVTISAEAKQETQDKIDLWTKDNARALGKMGRMCNKTVQLGFDATWLSSEAWSELKTKDSSKGWSTKWDVLNKLGQLFFKQRYQQSWCEDCQDPKGNQGTGYHHGGDGNYQTNEWFG